MASACFGTAPLIRGSGIQASSASSFTVSWPTGTIAGDQAFILAVGGYHPSCPTGWQAYSPLGSTWNGVICRKILTSGDITAGSVVVSFDGSYDAVLAIITLQGGAADLVEVLASSSSGASAALTEPRPGANFYAIYFGSNRAASTDTISRGSLLRQANDGSAASGALYAETAPTSGSVTYSYSAGGGNYQVLLVLEAIPTAPGINFLSHNFAHGSPAPATGPIDTRGATLITVCSSGSTLGTVSSSPSNLWNCLTGYGSRAQICYSYGPSTSAYQTFQCGAANVTCTVRSYTGTDPTAAVFQSGSDVGNYSASATSLGASSAISPAQAGELISGCWAHNHYFTGLSVDSGLTVGDSYSDDNVAESGASADLVDGSTSAITPVWSVTSSAAWMAVAGAAFIPAAPANRHKVIVVP